MSELGAGLIGTAFGAGLAYVLDLRKAARERAHQATLAANQHAERRAALATALLIDLRTVESTLLQYYKREHPTRTRGIEPTLFFDRVEHEIVIFGPKTVSKVLAVYTSTRDFFAVLRDERPNIGTDKQPLGDIDWTVRCKAGFALQAMPEAVEALVGEGGIFPAVRKVAVAIRPDLPTVMGRVFPRETAAGLEEIVD